MRPQPRWLAAAAVLLGATAVAGCASSSSPSLSSGPSAPGSAPAGTVTVTSSAPAAPSSSPATASPAPCATSSLRVRLGQGDGYAGGVYQPIDFTNTSAAPCTLYGFPGVSLVSGPSHTQLGPAAKRARTTPVKLVTLAPSATAHAVLQIINALNFPAATCHPAKASAVRVYPPNQTAPVYLPTTVPACTRPVQILYIAPVQPGPA
jgi:Domain of unknown function (DUF4232)